jgi:hypothetical protein
MWAAQASSAAFSPGVVATAPGGPVPPIFVCNARQVRKCGSTPGWQSARECLQEVKLRTGKGVWENFLSADLFSSWRDGDLSMRSSQNKQGLRSEDCGDRQGDAVEACNPLIRCTITGI